MRNAGSTHYATEPNVPGGAKSVMLSDAWRIVKTICLERAVILKKHRMSAIAVSSRSTVPASTLSTLPTKRKRKAAIR